MKQKALYLLVTVALLAGSTNAFAASLRSAEQTQQNISANNDQRCDIVTKKIETALGRYKNNYEVHRKIYQNAVTRTTALVKRLTEKGYDVSKLTADLATMDAKIKKLAADYAAYNKSLEDTKQYVCGESQGKFKDAVAAARKALVLVHADIVDIRNYEQTVIRPDLTSLRKQAEARKTTPPPPPANNQ